MPHIIGIGGCSRSGKSSLAQSIKDQLPSRQVLLLDMDDFVLPASEIPKIKDRTDWERPESVDFIQLCQTIKEQTDDHDLIVVEGILVFAHQELRKLFDVTIWMPISKKTFMKRRAEETRWGDEPDWFVEHVWKSYIRYGQYPGADFIVSGEEEVSHEVLNKIVNSY